MFDDFFKALGLPPGFMGQTQPFSLLQRMRPEPTFPGPYPFGPLPGFMPSMGGARIGPIPFSALLRGISSLPLGNLSMAAPPPPPPLPFPPMPGH